MAAANLIRSMPSGWLSADSITRNPVGGFSLFGTALLVLLCTLPPAAHAARPMITDDARITDADTCQLETWTKLNNGSTEYWAQPACNFGGNLELTLGADYTRNDIGPNTSDFLVQGKSLFKPLAPNSWGIGLASGLIHHELGGNDWYAYVPASLSLQDDALVLHGNLGMLSDHATGPHYLGWGVGAEIEITERTWLIAEGFDQSQGQPYYQIGVRHWIVPNQVQVDTTYGNRADLSVDEKWFSIGLRLLTDTQRQTR